MSSTARKQLAAAEVTLPAGHPLRRVPLVAGVLGAAGLGLALALAGGHAKQFYFSYLVAFLFWLSLALGGLFFVLTQFVTRAGWSVVVRRIAENAMGTLPLFVLLFVPVAIGAHDLYHWMHEEAVATDELLAGKRPYLNPTFFYVRAAVYLLCWAALGWWFRRRSLAQDEHGDHETTRKLQAYSAPAVLVFAITLTFAAFDWIMSLDPHWYSTIFGVYFFAGSAVAIFALLALVSVGLSRARLLGGAVNVEHFHDLGKLLFAFVCFWAYIAFSQYFLIWYANIPEETLWYLHRWQGSWRQLSLLLGVGHFPLPFFFLLPRTVKRRPMALSAAALWMLGLHYLDLYWLVMPTLQHHGAHFGLLDVATLVGVGGLFVASFAWLMQRAPLVPLKDPRLPESLAFENA